jgi:hypothetical protein
MIAAEGEILIFGGDDIPASRAAQAFQFFCPLFHHNIPLQNNPAYQVVIL